MENLKFLLKIKIFKKIRNLVKQWKFSLKMEIFKKIKLNSRKTRNFNWSNTTKSDVRLNTYYRDSNSFFARSFLILLDARLEIVKARLYTEEMRTQLLISFDRVSIKLLVSVITGHCKIGCMRMSRLRRMSLLAAF